MTFEFETERLYLREMTLADTDALLEVLADPVSMRFYPAPFDRAGVTAWIERQLKSYAERGHGLWAVVRTDTGEMIGDCGAMVQHPIDEEEIELGWHIHPAHQHLGYATEAAAACRDRCFAMLDVSRLVSMIGIENTPSQGVARRIGMQPTVRFDYKGMPHDLWVIERPLLGEPCDLNR